MTAELMNKANKALASARLLLNADDSDGATNRAYYAMFDAAIAALLWIDTAATRTIPKSHAGLIASFGISLIQTGHLPAGLGRSLNRVQELRLTADYLAEPVPWDKAAAAVREAEAFVEAVGHLLLTKPSAV